MRVSFDLAALKRTEWHEYVIRFLFGGAVTAAAGLLAKEFGPILGGLFLAFPAIFPASATLVQKHECEKKQRAGIKVTLRGKRAAGLDAFGAAQGSVGLVCFALLVWRQLPDYHALWILALATGAWFTISIMLWYTRKSAIAHRMANIWRS